MKPDMRKHNDVIYKSELIDLMQRIDEVLVNAGIKYFAVYGTCLGAARDGGIIPWDDDIDIAIMRCDYKTAIEKLSTSGQQLYVCNHNIDYRYPSVGCPKNSWRVFNRIDDSSSLERRRAYVDLFVIDYAPRNSIWFYWKVLWYIGISRIIERRDQTVGKKHPFLYFIADSMALPFRLLSSGVLSKFSDWLYVDAKPSELIKISGIVRKRYSAKEFESTIRMPFNGIEIEMPIGYEEYLTQTYNNWRVPLKPEERLSHACEETGKYWNVPYPDDKVRWLEGSLA